MLPHVLTRKCGIRPWITCQRGIYGWPCGVDGSKNWHQWSDCVPLDLLSESRMLMLQPSKRVFQFDWTFKIRSHVCMLPGNGWCMLVLLYRCSWVIALDGHFYSHGDVAHVCVCVSRCTIIGSSPLVLKRALDGCLPRAPWCMVLVSPKVTQHVMPKNKD